MEKRPKIVTAHFSFGPAPHFFPFTTCVCVNSLEQNISVGTLNRQDVIWLPDGHQVPRRRATGTVMEDFANIHNATEAKNSSSSTKSACRSLCPNDGAHPVRR
jgi:hypothetical protein